MFMASGIDSRDESQASQLLAAALRPREFQPASATSFPVNLDESHFHDGSLQSSGHSVHYHLPDLVATQTQSPYATEDRPNPEGSQKENTAASSDDKGKTSPPLDSSLVVDSTSPHSGPSCTDELKDTHPVVRPPVRLSKERPCPKNVGLRTKITQPPIKGGKAVSFASPSRPTSRLQIHIDRASTLPSRSLPPPSKHRSPSPVSQDSFVGPLPISDPARAFLAQAKNFAIPLSQLGEDSQSQSISEEDGPPPVPSSMWTNPKCETPPRPPSPKEKILVASTPSNSSHDSQSQSQPKTPQHPQSTDSQEGDTDADSSEFFPQAQTQTHDIDFSAYTDLPTQENDDGMGTTVPSPRDVSTEPSSSYERLLRQDPFETLPEATQIMDETPPTQAVDSTQATESVDVSSIVQNHDFYNDNEQMVFPSIRSSASRKTVPQKLRGLIAEDKWHRYKDFVRPSTHRSSPVHPSWDTTVQDTQPTVSEAPSNPVPEETQPTLLASDVAVHGSASSPPRHPKRMLPPANQVRRGLPATTPVGASDIDVVPDSDGLDRTQAVLDSKLPSTPNHGFPSSSSVETHHSPAKGRRGQLQSEDEVLRAIASEASSLPVVQEEEDASEEDEDEDEDEVPLAVIVRSAKAQGKQKATVPEDESTVLPSPPAELARRTKAPQSPTKGGIVRGVIQRSSSWKDAVIPSSDPRERHEELPKVKKAPATKSAKPRELPPAKPQTAPRAAKLAAREHLHESSTEDEDEDEETSSDNHDTMVVGEMDVDPKPQATRGNKRKRTVSSTKKVPSKSGGKVVKKEPSPLSTRPAKRRKSSLSAQAVSAIPATRVFALWKNTAKYYSGVVRQALDSVRYLIRFDDSDEAEIELKHIRACQLHEGDQVLVGQRRKVTVVGVPDFVELGHLPGDTVTIEYAHGEREEVAVQAIQIAARTAIADWGDRLLSDDAIVPVLKPTHMSPTPSRSLPSEGSARGAAKRLLAKTGMVVTLSPKVTGWEHQKDELMSSIKRLGGVVLDDWTCVFDMEGRLEQKGMRWMLAQEDIQWKKRADIDRVFLISDDHHQKSKFLIALALGIPCLSIQWLKDVVEEEDKDWPPYLLPAGFSEQLSARVSQMVDLDWGNSSHYLTNVTENLVAAKVFADKSILCISPDFVPSRQKSKKNGNGALKKEAAEAVPRIILCMGAANVEAVPDAKHASQDLEEYDYVVVREETDYSRYPGVEYCVNVGWVKDCLISGRLHPLPNSEDN